jgi:drug/metabolite transporter (DMT)-like permease
MAALALSLGIAIQNFPEGAIISMPLCEEGMSRGKAVFYGVLSGAVAYTLQIVGQQTTDPTVASIIMSLESVFAALGGWLVLSESLSAVELVGCALVFAAVLLAQAPDLLSAEGA